MAKFYGKVGIANTVEVRPGVWEDVIEERMYYGDVLKDTAKWNQGEYLNKDISVANLISIVADAYAVDHIFNIRYVEWSGALWSVSDVENARPRLQLRLGGVYNGPIPD